MARVINQGVVVTIRINNAGQVGNQVQQIGQRGQDAFAGWNSALATISKALLSMVGVLTAWTIFITVPEKLAAAFIDLATASVKSAAAIDQTILSTAGLLASFGSFGPTVGASFDNATIASTKLQIKFAEIAGKTIGSIQDINKAFDTFVSRGGLAMTKNLSDAAEAAGLLTQYVLTLTQGQSKERQIASEINGLLTNQTAATNIMARLIKARVGDLDAWLAKARQSHEFTKMLAEALPGLAESGNKLGNTLTGVLTTIQGNLAFLNDVVSHAGGGFEFVLAYLKKWRDILQDTVNDIGNMKNGFDSLKPTTQAILMDFMMFQESIAQILLGLDAMLQSLTGAATPLSILDTIARDLLYVAILIRSIMENLNIKAITTLIAAVTSIYGVITLIMSGGAVGTIAAMGAALLEWIPLIAAVGAGLLLISYALGGTFKKATAEAEKDMVDMKTKLDAFFKTLQQPTKFTLFPAAPDEATAVMQKTIIKLRHDLETATNEGNKYAQIWTNIRERIAEAAIEMKKNASEFAIAKGLLTAIGYAQTRTMIDAKNWELSVKSIKEDYGAIAALNAEESRVLAQINDANITDLDLRNEIIEAIKSQYNTERDLTKEINNRAGNEWLSQLNREMPTLNDYQSELSRILEEQVILFNELTIKSKEYAGAEGKRLIEDLTAAIRKLTDARIQALDVRAEMEGFSAQHEQNGILLTDIKEMSASYKDYSAAALATTKDITRLNEMKRQGLITDKEASAKQKELTDDLKAYRETMKSLMFTGLSLKSVMQEIFARLLLDHKKFGDVMKDMSVQIKVAIGTAVSSFIAGMISSSSAIPAWKKVLASILQTLAELAMALATLSLAGNLSPALAGIFGGPAATIALFAAAGVLMGLAAKLGGGGGGAGASSGSGGGSGSSAGSGNRIIYINPVGQSNSGLVQTMTSLNNTLTGLQTQPAGVLVKQAAGDPGVMKVVTKGVDASLQGDVGMNNSFRKTVLGEA